MKIIGIPGSARKESFNKRFLVWIGHLMAQYDTSIEIVDIGEIPISLGDFNQQSEEVIQLKKQIKNSDGIIFSTPQYNYTYPQILKNTIDWIANPDSDNSWNGKKVYIVGVSMDTTGVIKAIGNLKSYLQSLGAIVYEGEFIAINRAHGMFGDDDRLLDNKLQASTEKAIKDVISWFKK